MPACGIKIEQMSDLGLGLSGLVVFGCKPVGQGDGLEPERYGTACSASSEEPEELLVAVPHAADESATQDTSLAKAQARALPILPNSRTGGG